MSAGKSHWEHVASVDTNESYTFVLMETQCAALFRLIFVTVTLVLIKHARSSASQTQVPCFAIEQVRLAQ